MWHGKSSYPWWFSFCFQLKDNRFLGNEVTPSALGLWKMLITFRFLSVVPIVLKCLGSS